MSKISPHIVIAHSRRGFLKRGLGLGIGGLVAGCGRTVIGGSGGQLTGVGGPSGSGPNGPTDPTQPSEPPKPPEPPKLPDTQPPLSGVILQGAATVTSNVVGTIGDDFMGLSFGKERAAYFTSSNTNLIDRFKDLGSGVLRITASENFTWEADAAFGTSGKTSKADIDNLAAFLRVVGWKVIYGIPLRDNIESLAADEAAYATQRLGDSLYCFELGNEPDTFGWDYATFKQKWLRLNAAILAAGKAPNALFSGPDAANNAERYSARFADELKASNIKLTLLTQHHYRIRSTIEKSIASLLVTPDPILTTGIPGFDPVAKLPTLKAAADRSNIPFRITETNSGVNGGVPDVSDTYASALWCIDLMFTVAKGGGQGVNFHAGGGAAYTPLRFNGSLLDATKGIQPEYYGLRFFAMAGRGSMLETTISASNQNISAYAIDTGAGKSVMFVNKSQLSFEIALQLPAPAATITATYLYVDVNALTSPPVNGDTLPAKIGIRIQNGMIGVSTGLVGMAAPYTIRSNGSSATVNVPALTAVLVKAS